MESRNLSFLDDVSDDFKISTLHILKDGEEVDLAIEEIFDKDTFDHLIGVTYSISPSFVNKYLIDFASCELVIGIDNDYIKDSINRLAKHLKENILDQIQGEPIKFYDELAMKAKFNLDRGALKVWVSASHLIHSKFYLLWNDRGDKRLVLGSANLSQRAFDKASVQFENILILDDSSYFDTYMAYYRDSLSKVLTDYIPKDLKKLNAKTFKNISSIDEISADEVFIISNDQVANIKEKAVVDIIEDVKDKISLGICEDSLISQLDNIDSDRAAQKRDEKMKADAEEVSFELAKELINKRKNEPALYSKETISKKVRKKVEKISVREVENTSAIERVELFSKRDLRNSRKDMTGLFVRSSLNSNNLIPFGKKASQEDLARSLKCLYTVVDEIIIGKLEEELKFLFDDIILINRIKNSFEIDKNKQNYTILELYRACGVKISESIIAKDLAEDFIKKLPSDIEFIYNKPGEIDLRPNKDFKHDTPKEYEFKSCVDNFFANAMEVSLYINQKDPIAASIKMEDLRRQLIKMLNFHLIDKFYGLRNMGKDGSNLINSLSKEDREDLELSFNTNDLVDIYTCLFKACNLFRKVGMQEAANLGFPYNKEADVNTLKLLRENYRKLESFLR